MSRRGCVWLVLTGALAGGALAAQAPTGTITGHVTDAPTRRPVVGVRVTVVGSDRGAVTRDDGGYTLADVPEGAHRVRASRIGFTAQEQTVVVIAGQSVTADFTLSTVAVSLSDVVVVGYGTQRRADLTGAVVSVPPDQIQKAAVVSLQQALQGSVPGATVTQGDAAPGGAISVLIRGATSTSAHDYATYVNQANLNAGQQAPYGGRTGSIGPDSIARLYGAGIDWQRAIFRTAATRDLQLSFSGGDGNGSYAVSGNYFDQDGAIRGSGFGRGGVRANLDRRLNSIVRISSSLDVTRSNANLVRSSGTEGTNHDGLVIVSGSEFVYLVHKELVKFDRGIGTDHHLDPVAGFIYVWNRSNWNKDQVSKFPDDLLRSSALQRGLAWAAPQSGV